MLFSIFRKLTFFMENSVDPGQLKKPADLDLLFTIDFISGSTLFQ